MEKNEWEQRAQKIGDQLGWAKTNSLVRPEVLQRAQDCTDESKPISGIHQASGLEDALRRMDDTISASAKSVAVLGDRLERIRRPLPPEPMADGWKCGACESPLVTTLSSLAGRVAAISEGLYAILESLDI